MAGDQDHASVHIRFLPRLLVVAGYQPFQLISYFTHLSPAGLSTVDLDRQPMQKGLELYLLALNLALSAHAMLRPI
jgi:hypothetical protein